MSGVAHGMQSTLAWVADVVGHVIYEAEEHVEGRIGKDQKPKSSKSIHVLPWPLIIKETNTLGDLAKLYRCDFKSLCIVNNMLIDPKVRTLQTK